MTLSIYYASSFVMNRHICGIYNKIKLNKNKNYNTINAWLHLDIGCLLSELCKGIIKDVNFECLVQGQFLD